MRNRNRRTLTLALAAAVLTAGAVLGTAIANGSSTPTQTDTTATQAETTPTVATPPPVDDANLELIARSAATRFGEKEPTDPVVVTDVYNKSAIATLTGAIVEKAGEGVADVVQEHGNFRVPTTPYGETPPTGHSLTIVISRETREATGIFMAEGEDAGPNLADLDRGNAVPLQ